MADLDERLSQITARIGRIESGFDSREPMVCLTLGEAAALLSQVKDKTAKVLYDFGGFAPTRPNSYRGYYDHLALGFAQAKWDETPTAGAVLEWLNDANGAAFHGYKGGEFLMHRNTPLWVANYGECHDTGLVGVCDEGWKVILSTGYVRD